MAAIHLLSNGVRPAADARARRSRVEHPEAALPPVKPITARQFLFTVAIQTGAGGGGRRIGRKTWTYSHEVVYVRTTGFNHTLWLTITLCTTLHHRPARALCLSALARHLLPAYPPLSIRDGHWYHRGLKNQQEPNESRTCWLLSREDCSPGTKPRLPPEVPRKCRWLSRPG